MKFKLLRVIILKSLASYLYETYLIHFIQGALVHRMLFWSDRNTSRIDSTQIKEKCASLENMKFVKAKLEDQFSSLQLIANSTEQMNKGENDQRSLIQKHNFLSFFNTYGLDDIQLEDSNGVVISIVFFIDENKCSISKTVLKLTKFTFAKNT